MKIVFFGSAHFAVPSLEALIKNNHDICCVVTQPDKKKGRHLHLAATDVKSISEGSGLNIYQPKDVNSQESVAYLKRFGADLFVIVAYGQILSQEVLDIPKIFPINIHASILPKYRGAAPINWAIIYGEEVSGVSIIKVTRKMDSGPVIIQREVPISGETDSVALEDKLRLVGSDLLIEALERIKTNKYKLLEQDENKVVFAPKLKKFDGHINWSNSAQSIHDLIRGTLPWPSAFTHYKGKLLKIYKSEVIDASTKSAGLSCGQVAAITKEAIIVVTGEGDLAVKELQLEGGHRMIAKDFVHGHKVALGYAFGKK